MSAVASKIRQKQVDNEVESAAADPQGVCQTVRSSNRRYLQALWVLSSSLITDSNLCVRVQDFDDFSITRITNLEYVAGCLDVRQTAVAERLVRMRKGRGVSAI
jgi:hypothetical protein